MMALFDLHCKNTLLDDSIPVWTQTEGLEILIYEKDKTTSFMIFSIATDLYFIVC